MTTPRDLNAAYENLVQGADGAVYLLAKEVRQLRERERLLERELAEARRQLENFEFDALGSSISWFEEAKKLAARNVAYTRH